MSGVLAKVILCLKGLWIRDWRYAIAGSGPDGEGREICL